MIRKTFSALFGFFFLVLGALLLLKTTGLINISIGQAFATYWPVGLVLIGLALIAKQRLIAVIILVCVLFMGGMYASENFGFEQGEYREITQNVPYESGIEEMELKIGFGPCYVFSF